MCDSATSVLDAVVHRGRAAGVAAVLVGGEVIRRDGRFTRVDRAAVPEELAAALRIPLRADEEPRRHVAAAVFPHVRRFYDGWLDEGARDPYYRQNSRR